MDGRDDQATDARLSIAASQGDDEAFGLLYERYAPRITAYLCRLLDDEHLAQDLTHEVFVSALRRLRTDRPPIAFGPWLYRIARNASIDVHRRSQIVRQVPLDGDGAERPAISREHAPEAVAEVRQWLEQLRDVLGGLSETHRTVLVLRELEGLSNGEIGDRLGLSRPAVEGLLFRARAKLRSEYDELVSGRRCELVQVALDRARDGTRLGVRDLELAARHVRGCAQCRRHAWEAGLVTVLQEADGLAPRRRALIPVPLAVAALTHRVAVKLGVLGRSLADPPAALAAPWGRAAAGVVALAIAGGVAVPPVRHAVVDRPAPARASAATVLTARQKQPAASPSAAPTTLLASAVPMRAGSAGAPPPDPAPAPARAAPAQAAPASSPAAAPTALPDDSAPAGRAEPAHHEASGHRSGTPAAATPAPPDVDPSAAPGATATTAAVHHVVQHVTHRGRHPVAPPTTHTAQTVGGVLSQATETAAAVVDRAADQQPSSEVADPAPAPVPDPVPAAPAPAPDAAPAPAPVPVPAAPALPSAPTPDPQPPAVPDTTTVPAPADATPAPPSTDGTLAERRAASGLR